MPPILFAVESATSRSPPLSSQELVNAFVERQAPDAKSPAPIFGRPGMAAFATLGSPIRGFWNFNGTAFFVSGQALCSVNQAGVVSSYAGAAIAGTGPVSMADNGTQLCIVNGLSGWIFTTLLGVRQITASAFYPANTVRFMDGYFIFDRAGTNQFFLSALYDGMIYNGLDFATAEAEPGTLTTTVQNLQLLFLVCSAHIEIWYDAGSADFPFQRYAGGVINYGSVSPFSVIKQDGAIFFLGADAVVYRLQANIAIRISTHSMEHLITQEKYADNLLLNVCQTFTLEGHKFVFLTLTSTLQTIVFDISTGKWHKWRSHDANAKSLGIWRGACSLEIYNGVLIGDAFNGQIGVLSWTTYTEYGNPIILLARSAPIHHGRSYLFATKFELDIQAGVGLVAGQGSSPQAMLRYSRDGGQTWSGELRWKSMGAIGAFAARLRWFGFGRGLQYVFEITISDPVWRVIIAADLDMEIGT